MERARKIEHWSRMSRALANAVVVEKGEMLCLDTSTGLLTKGAASTTLLPVGYASENMTGDGSTEIGCDLFEEMTLHFFDNDSDPNAVAESDVGSEVYVKDERTVSTSSGGSTRSIAGRAWVVDSRGVGLQLGSAVTGPTGGASGVADSVADRTALAAVAAIDRRNGQLLLVRSDGSLWRFDSASTLESDEAEELAVEPAVGTGCWLRADKTFVMKVPIDFSMADGATIFTCPAGFALRLSGLPFWEVTTGWTGGTGSAIAVASSVTGYTGAGDILGGASGNVTALLGTAGVKAGTIGAKMDSYAEHQAFVMVEGDTLTYEELTDAFLAGDGFVCVPVNVMVVAA